MTLALTSIVITFAFTTLNYTQKLFYNYKTQNTFINEYTDLKKRMDFESLKADFIVEETNNVFTIKRDSTTSTLDIKEKVILLRKGEICDTFHIEVKNLEKQYEPMKNPLWTNKLLKSLTFETEFTKQKFSFKFYKNYDASIKLSLDQTE